MGFVSYQERMETMHRLLIITLLIFVYSCSSAKQQDIPNSLTDYLKNNGVQDMHKDYEFTTPNQVDRKYMAITVTYNFSTAEGKAQKEYLGFILRQDNQEWKIERNTAYTINEQKAKDLLAGAK
jgi:hypothetical protein